MDQVCVIRSQTSLVVQPIRFSMRFSSFLICLLAGAVHAAPAAQPLGVDIGVKFDKRQDELPTLTLPYGTWRASDYNADADVGKSYSTSTTQH